MRKFKNILVTGGLGFIGINFCDHLLKNYDLKIINIDKKTYASNNSTIHHYDKKYKLYKIDIADKKRDKDGKYPHIVRIERKQYEHEQRMEKQKKREINKEKNVKKQEKNLCIQVTESIEI